MTDFDYYSAGGRVIMDIDQVNARAITIAVLDKVTDHFDGNFKKALRWFIHCNPHLGGTSPMDMILMGRGEKLLKWVEQTTSIGEIEE